METIQNLIAQQYSLFNVNDKKLPIDGNTNKLLTEWQKKSYKELLTHHNYSINRWGMRQGLHENGRKTMSLDFDMNHKCVITQEFYNKYIDGTKSNDGMYSSSTCGNWNILIDYTDNKEICDLASTIENRIKLGDLEIFTGGNQVIPPSKTVCKIHNKLCVARCWKSQNPILCLESNSTFQSEFIKELFSKLRSQNLIKKKVIKDKMKNEIKEQKTTITSFINPKWKEFIEDVMIHNPEEIKYPEWLKIATVFKTNGLTKREWLSWDKSEANKTPTANDTWEGIKRTENMDFATLINIVKNIPFYKEQYINWIEKYSKFISLEDLDLANNTSNIISKTLKETLIHCKDKWFVLNKTTQLWSLIKIPTKNILQELHSYIDYSNKKITNKIAQTEGEEKEKNIAISKKYLSYYKLIEGSSYLSVLTKCLMSDLLDNDFENKLDINAGKLAFKNGIMDLESKQFREGIQWNDFLTKTIPYDYQKANFEKKEFLYNKLKEILNNNKEHLDYFLSVIGFSFIGMPNLEKSIYFCVDKTTQSNGDNGKTFFFDILSTLLPNYVYKTKGSFLEDGNTKLHKQFINMKGMRLVWLDEYGKKKTNAELMKEIGDGLSSENEIMHGTTEKINILFKMFALTNHMPHIDPNDSAVYNRYKQISYGSHFDRTGKRTEPNPEELEFIADPSLGDKIKSEYYNEVFELIIEYANNYYSKKIPSIPSQFIKDTAETKDNNDEFATWFSENCIKVNFYKTPLKLLVSESGKHEKDIKEGMKRQGFKYNKDLSGFIEKPYTGYYKGGFIGIKISENIEN